MRERQSKVNLPPPNGKSKDWAYISAGAKLSPAAAKKIEIELESSPSDLASRLMLLGFYGRRTSQQEKYFKHMLWMIDRRPGDYLCADLGREYHSRSFVWTKAQISEANIHWTRQFGKHSRNVRVLCNAANFFSEHDWLTSEKLYKRAKKLDPTLALPARRLAYAYRSLASEAPESERPKIIRSALREAEQAADRREESRGEKIGILQEFTPAAIKFGHLKLARKFAKRLQYYGTTSFYLWEQYACIYLAWIDLLEGRFRGINFKLQRLRELFEAEPNFVASSNAAISFVNDAFRLGEEPLAQYILQILIMGSREAEKSKEQGELKEWFNSISENRKPKLRILKKKLNSLF